MKIGIYENESHIKVVVSPDGQLMLSRLFGHYQGYEPSSVAIFVDVNDDVNDYPMTIAELERIGRAVADSKKLRKLRICLRFSDFGCFPREPPLINMWQNFLEIMSGNRSIEELRLFGMPFVNQLRPILEENDELQQFDFFDDEASAEEIHAVVTSFCHAARCLCKNSNSTFTKTQKNWLQFVAKITMFFP